ncbi:PREDICTED: uncharacterized protein LOC109464398 [Branchiostoma belcheri]|uniref:Uncharacterized protein LOC109464398 n=1 Tax=Branchiostoma belcheri TaxID=7741 RepID=A0A6P4YDT9_BRABE|nr:PREDICTED: uncharacterized protein LOC109464398 [Branchiostoma belcheri]XP_019616927.1 PREDICTED: uncharacterized protein LOC109464398 [Branchiostoma belcheri]
MFLPRVMWVPKGQGRSITQPGFSERLEIDGVKESQKESAGELEYCTKKKDVRPVVEPLVEPVRKKVKLAKAELQYLPINAVPICVKAGVSSEPKCSSEGNVKDAGSTPLDVPETSGKTCSVGQSGEENVKSPNHVAKIGRKDSQMEQNDVYHARTFTVVINKPYVDIMSKANPSPLRSPHLVKTRHQCGKKPVHYTPIRRGQHLASTWRKLHGEEKTDQNNRSLLSARFAKLRNKNAPKEQTVANNSPEKTPTSGIPVPPVHEWLSSFFGTSISYGSSHSDTGGSTDDDSSFVKLRSMLKALQTGNIDQLKAGDGGDLVEEDDDMKDFNLENSSSNEDDEEYYDDDIFAHLEEDQEEDMDTSCTDVTLQESNSMAEVSDDGRNDVKKHPKNVWGILDMKHNNNNNNNVENSGGRSSPVVESWLQATYKGGKNMKLSEEEIPTSCAEDMELIDWKQLMCLLCKRKFNCKEALLSHQQFSNLHQSNLEFKRRALEEELKVLEMELDPSSSSSVFSCT